MPEPVDFQVNNHMAFQNAMVKNQIRLEIVLVNQNATLSCLKAETTTQFQQTLL